MLPILEIEPGPSIAGLLRQLLPRTGAIAVDFGQIPDPVDPFEAPPLDLAEELAGLAVAMLPVLRAYESPRRLAAHGLAARMHRRRAVLRLQPHVDAGSPAEADAVTGRLLARAGLEIDEIDLLIDLAETACVAHADHVEEQARRVVRWARTLPWRSVSVASGAMPANLDDLPTDRPVGVGRLDAGVWQRLGEPGVGYADYGVTSPVRRWGVQRHRQLPTLRYTRRAGRNCRTLVLMLLTAALAYARHGIPVLPVHTPDPDRGCSCDKGVRCERPGKHPRLRHGLTEASTDPREIELWWERWPAANIGLRTGIAMDVADVDSTEGKDGLRHLLGGAMPAGPQVRTGGGWHFWFRPTGFGNRVRLLPGLDWRGIGGYVVAPPSRHFHGDYRWLRRPGETLPAGSGMLLGLIEGPTVTPVPARRPIAHPERYASAALAAEADRVARALVGSRNDTLNRAAFALGRLVGGGLLDAAEVTRALERAARYAGLGRAEIRRTIRSGLTAGRRVPIDPEVGRRAA